MAMGGRTIMAIDTKIDGARNVLRTYAITSPEPSITGVRWNQRIDAHLGLRP